MKNDRHEEIDYKPFGLPFLLIVDKVLSRIRNLTAQELPSGALFPVETAPCDPRISPEVQRKCIAHQGCGLRGKINEWLLDKLPEMLNKDRKMDKIHNLVSSLSGKRIRNIGRRGTSRGVLAEDDKQVLKEVKSKY